MQKLTKKQGGTTVQCGATTGKSLSVCMFCSTRYEATAQWFDEGVTKAINVNSEPARRMLERIKSLRVVCGVALTQLLLAWKPLTLRRRCSNGQVATLAIGSYALQEIAQSR